MISRLFLGETFLSVCFTFLHLHLTYGNIYILHKTGEKKSWIYISHLALRYLTVSRNARFKIAFFTFFFLSEPTCQKPTHVLSFSDTFIMSGMGLPFWPKLYSMTNLLHVHRAGILNMQNKLSISGSHKSCCNTDKCQMLSFTHLISHTQTRLSFCTFPVE